MSWYSSLLVGVFPFLVAGWTASALANRLEFVAWGMASAGIYAVLLRHGFQAGWRQTTLACVMLLILAAGWAGFGHLVARHREVLDLAFRAVLPALYHPILTRPALGYGLAVLLVLMAAALGLFGQLRARRTLLDTARSS